MSQLEASRPKRTSRNPHVGAVCSDFPPFFPFVIFPLHHLFSLDSSIIHSVLRDPFCLSSRSPTVRALTIYPHFDYHFCKFSISRSSTVLPSSSSDHRHSLLSHHLSIRPRYLKHPKLVLNTDGVLPKQKSSSLAKHHFRPIGLWNFWI